MACLAALALSVAQAQLPRGDAAGAWRSLFNGVSLGGWKATEFYKPGAVKVEEAFQDGTGAIVLEAGVFLTGITWADPAPLPKTNYEFSVEAMKLAGHDFFCGLTFAVRDSAVTLVVGGWGGTVVGLSSIDDNDASENETGQGMTFDLNRWYRIRVRVTEEKIEAWIDNRQIIDFETRERKISLRGGEIEKSLPLGIAAYQTRAALRHLELRRLPTTPEGKSEPKP